ncbi:fatty acid desaturase chloroplastic [Raphidocelis subcapitata]|uniref:Fatty acid desaturase chloroplastic n=1 Tax=Raphidocelis subcapitata TaxID=307507 RepID=A0A2V0PPQ9_9CHLO|nr:fatty acid desaturase chloroplastic [Raphidocelis subcapitata]|eukprot:GBG00164.1 fatty acid desaturase chloroplastic [Raphidocelis subcapitata]
MLQHRSLAGRALPGAQQRPCVASARRVIVRAKEPIVAATTLLEKEQEAAPSAAPGRGAAGAPSTSGSKWVIDESELLTSTAEHRAWTFGPMALMGAALAVAGSHVDGPGGALSAASAVLAAYVLSDLGTGVYHWSVDNYGDGSTPVFGRQIAAFQGHHVRPWTITQREFCNNVHQVFKPAAYPAGGMLLLSPVLGVWPGFFLPSFLFLVCMSQQFHAWSHMKKSELPAAVVALQDAGVLIGRAAHGAHHRPNFEGNYCIVSGWWNQALDDSGFFRWLEKVVVATTGVEPRCWYPPEHGWIEEVRPQAK